MEEGNAIDRPIAQHTHVMKNTALENSGRKGKYHRAGMASEVLWKQVRRFEPIEFHYVTVAQRGKGTRDVRRSGS